MNCPTCADGDHIIHGHELPAVGSRWRGPSGIVYRVERVLEHPTEEDAADIYMRGEGRTRRGNPRATRREMFGYFRRAFEKA